MKGVGVSLAEYPSYHASFVFCHRSCLKNDSCIFNFLAQPGILGYSFRSQTAALQPTERWKQRNEWALPVPMQRKFHSGESRSNSISKNFSKRKLLDAPSQALCRHDLTPFSPSPYEEGIFISPRYRWQLWEIREGPYHVSDSKWQCWHLNAAISSSEVCIHSPQHTVFLLTLYGHNSQLWDATGDDISNYDCPVFHALHSIDQ